MRLMISKAEGFGLPRTPNFNSHMFTFIERPGTTLVILGHPPRLLLEQAFDLPGLPRKLVVRQEEMHATPRTYDVWTGQGEMKTYPLTQTLYDALGLGPPARPQAAPQPAPAAPKPQAPSQPAPAPKPQAPSEPAAATVKDASGILLPTVIAAGLADGINPCAFAVMAFFTAVLFALRRTRQYIFKLGAAYIVAMYVTYFAIGLGLMRGLELLGQPHLVIQGGAVFVILLGIVQMKDALFPRLPLHLTVPKPGWELIQSWAKRANMPAAVVVGALVGLCTLPCSGGIYVAILGLLASQSSFAGGVGYLALYNLMFIAPLVAILLVVSSRPMSLALAGWERGHVRSIHGAIGLVMIALGVFILGWLH